MTLAVTNGTRLVHLKTPHCCGRSCAILAISASLVQRVLRLALHGCPSLDVLLRHLAKLMKMKTNKNKNSSNNNNKQQLVEAIEQEFRCSAGALRKTSEPERTCNETLARYTPRLGLGFGLPCSHGSQGWRYQRTLPMGIKIDIWWVILRLRIFYLTDCFRQNRLKPC